MDAAIELLNSTPLASLMLMIALGFVLGRPRWLGISLGAAGGTLLTALILSLIHI